MNREREREQGKKKIIFYDKFKIKSSSIFHGRFRWVIYLSSQQYH